ncbi:hypothetical protein [Burkholderia sp. Bp9142]|uniref:hypothetical protein n=1 Tax=Burkholderia sp. Bp9142 TaxID=2184573 RepID=UPI0016285E23|nr:hypothetical protein [Burkholderia sp. Bp9142]
MVDFDHGALAQEAFEAAVQVSKIIHAARMPRAWERVTRWRLCRAERQRELGRASRYRDK